MGDGTAGEVSRGVHHQLERAASNPPGQPGAEALKAAGLQRPLSYFAHAHRGWPALVIGGGPSRSAGVAAAPPPDEAIYIGANDHGSPWPCRYAVALDMIEKRMAAQGAPVASTKRFGTIRIFVQRAHQSGMMGVYLAWAMGCSPILLAGMDCYAGGTYEGNPDARSSSKNVPVYSHLNAWRKLHGIVTADIRALTAGPLSEQRVFPLHDPGVPPAVPAPLARIYAEVCGIVVEFTRNCRIPPAEYQRGDIAEIGTNEAKRYRASLTVLGDPRRDWSLLANTVPARITTTGR